jgi:hypothetical protein
MIHLARILAAVAVTAAMITSCGPSASPGRHWPAASAGASDPPTVSALLRIAQVFNNDYDNGRFGAVYDRWDGRSQALISRGEYIRRHALCAPATHSAAVVEAAARGTGGAWHVSYRIDGSSLVDTWFYVRHRWVFDIISSNPGAARDYRLPFARYAAAVGCTVH